MGCAAAQGWYFSKPLDAVSATAWLADRDPAADRIRQIAPAAASQPVSGVTTPPAGYPA